MSQETVSHSRRVLVAEDDAVTRRLIATVLKGDECEMVSVDNASKAYRVLRSDADFNVAIFDMKLPNPEGLEVIRYMRTEKRLMRIPVMITSSEQSIKLMADGFAAGAAVFLPKPFSVAQLRTMLLMLFSKSHEQCSSSQVKTKALSLY